MPHYWNNILVVTKDELVPAWWNTFNTLKSEIRRYKDKPYGIKRTQIGGNGRQLLISFDSLPQHIQDGIGDPRKLDHQLERYYYVDGDAVRFYHDWQYPNTSNYLTPASQEQYIINASVLKTLLRWNEASIAEILSKRGTKPRKRNEAMLYELKTFEETLRVKYGVEHNLPTSLQRFAQMMKSFEKEGYEALIKDRNAQSQQNARKVGEDIIKLLNDLFASQPHKPTPKEVAYQYEAFLNGELDIINSKTGEIYEPEDYPKISISTSRAYLTQWANKIGTHTKRSGNNQELMRKFKPYHSLLQPEMAGSLLSIDDRQPPFWYAKGKRVWFYNAIDLGSEAFTCWVWGKTKEGLILNFYQQLVRNYHEWGFNLPYEMECESSLNSSFKDTFLRNGAMFEKVRIEANNARGKRIEAYYRKLRYHHEKERAGWLARPSALSEANQAGNQPRIIIPYEDIVDGCIDDIETWNNTEHSKIKGKSRWDVFCDTQNPRTRPINYKSFMQYIGFKQETSCNAGTIMLQYTEFVLGDNGEIYFGDPLIELMKKVEGKDITIYWLDANDGSMLKAMVYIGDRYICEALPKPRYHRATAERTNECKEERELMSAYVATITRFQREQASAIEPVTVLNNKPKTINNNFQISSRKRYEPRQGEAKTLGRAFDEDLEETLENIPAYTPGASRGNVKPSPFKL